MTKQNELIFWKLVAAGAALFYLYKVTKANGGTLAGNPMGVNVNEQKFVDLASQFVPKEYRGHAKQLGAVVFNKFMNS